MRFLVDNALSPQLAVLLSTAGQTATHVRGLGMQRAPDEEIFERATADDAVIVSADTDFSALLAARSTSKPSVIVFRGPGSRRPDALATTLLANLDQLRPDLEAGAIVTIEPSRIRVRRLPIYSAPKNR
jgi:predicted nuclease of predicted toxin-antitoxin system